jgi:hypothetical protein
MVIIRPTYKTIKKITTLSSPHFFEVYELGKWRALKRKSLASSKHLPSSNFIFQVVAMCMEKKVQACHHHLRRKTELPDDAKSGF